jgi:hypothetical protein
VGDIGPGAAAMAIDFVLSLRYPLLQLRDTLLQIGCFDGAQMQAQEGRQGGNDQSGSGLFASVPVDKANSQDHAQPTEAMRRA